MTEEKFVNTADVTRKQALPKSLRFIFLGFLFNATPS